MVRCWLKGTQKKTTKHKGHWKNRLWTATRFCIYVLRPYKSSVCLRLVPFLFWSPRMPDAHIVTSNQCQGLTKSATEWNCCFCLFCLFFPCPWNGLICRPVTGISRRPPFYAFSNQISCPLTLLTGDKLTPDKLVVLSHFRGGWWRWWWRCWWCWWRWWWGGIIPFRGDGSWLCEAEMQA